MGYVAAVVLAVGISAALFAVGFLVLVERRRWLPAQYSRRVIVHTTDDSSIEGTLTSSSSDGVVLLAAKLLDEHDTPLAGDIFVPDAKVHFVQLITV